MQRTRHWTDNDAVQSQGPRRAWPVVIVAVVAVPAITITLLASSRYRDLWRDDPWGRPVQALHLLAVAALCLGGALLARRRPANRCGAVAVVLGIVFGLWYIAFASLPQEGNWQLAQPVLTYSLRLLLFWLVLAFPIGRLDRSSRRLFGIYAAATVAVCAVYEFSVADTSIQLYNASTWTLLVQSVWWDVGAFVFLAAILVIVKRRQLRFRGQSGARIIGAALLAAVAATSADFFLVASGPLRSLQNDPSTTPWGTVVLSVDFGRWGLVAVILAFAARGAWPRDEPVDASIDLDAAALDRSLRDTIVDALGDPTADIALVAAGRGWVDSAGTPRAAPEEGPATTFVRHQGVPIAALEYNAEIAAHPALLDTAVSAVALQLEARRQTALAEALEGDLRSLARDVMDAEDQARRALERDLHDGAQQALVGVSLQAALAARGDGHSAAGGTDLADSIDTARAELMRIASGRPPSLLAERGLEGAVGALVLTAGIPVRVHAEGMTRLSDRLQRVIWFTAAEAVTNALKHASPSELTLTLTRANGSVTLTVGDDGRGGVDTAPRALAERVAEAGGTLDIESTTRGTTVRARFAEAGR